MKQSVTYPTDKGRHTEQTDWVSAGRSFRHFHNRLSQILLKSDYRKRGQKVNVIPVLECKNGRYHYHCAIENPTEHDKVFIQTVKKCWSKSTLGLPDTDCQQIYNDEWVGYVLKTQANNYNTIDWSNCYWGR